jgi:fatty-acyl-CoA synthase
MIEILASAARDYPDVPAIVAEDGALTYRELFDSLDPTTGRQCIALPNGVGWHGAFWSAMAGGAIVTVLNPRAKPAELDYIRSDFLRDTALSPGTGAAPGDVRVVQYTAGTSGFPKGALLTAEGLVTVARGHASSWRLSPGDAIFVPNPTSHIMGLVLGCLMPAVAQATVVTMSRFDAVLALELIERHRPVAMAGTPSHYQMLAEHADLGRRDISSLRFGLAGGAASTPEAVRRITDRLGLEALLNGYGMTEACGSISRTEIGDPLEAHAFTAGRPMPWLQTRLTDGQLFIKGRPVTTGYLGDPASALDAEGWFPTGDLFERDEAGRLRFKGRLKDVISVGGFKVYPAEVERVLSKHPAIEQAQVVGVPDDRLGEIPIAFVRLADGESGVREEDLQRFCSENLSGYKVPRRIHPVDEFPTNSAGKVLKYRLRELATATS